MAFYTLLASANSRTSGPVIRPVERGRLLPGESVDFEQCFKWEQQLMAHDVFISYSSQDSPAARQVCGSLEAAGIRCWMAPRDIVPGSDYGAAIITALSTAPVMVLIFSSHSNQSRQVRLHPVMLRGRAPSQMWKGALSKRSIRRCTCGRR